MNCVDLQRSLAGVEDLSTAEHIAEHALERQAHLKTCAACSALVAELDLIAASASELRAAEEPSPRVWNSIAMALQQEGLIRQANQPFVVSKPVARRGVTSAAVSSRSIAASAAASRGFSSFAAGWGWRGWLVPAAAVLLIAVGVFVNQRSVVYQLSKHIAPATATATRAQTLAAWNLAGLNDDDLLQEIQNQSPELRAQYVDNLRNANDYIRDAQSAVDANPNDEESRRSLLEAYQQKAMLFEMAMDRSLP
ncbi:MAG: hypothetical protein WBQ08_03370 [Candidatus Sulfotelmatobacter sp.]